MTSDEIIAVIQAHKDGKTIQVRTKGYPSELHPWLECVSLPEWNFSSADYRVKPELREFWIYDDHCNCPPHAYPVEQVFICMPPLKGIHVREVLE